MHRGKIHKFLRGVLVAVIMANLALLAAAGPLRATLLRYDVARKRKELRELTLRHRELLREVADARRHERVMARARELGVVPPAEPAGPEAVVSAAGRSGP